ncbi:hypothetical protein [Magnetofaba australis]|uniref:DUF2802 domain-containing protein n=1 Tax=Magnetofaba australis IT-1 TaxID=1434232 RepID=A0A1Y2K200_9PROT|nr:hypothetical protein [Magnetofaba australis]OSM02071.1 hypothetical protein MAIT1_02156 [Magnetofaba australis IT-1]
MTLWNLLVIICFAVLYLGLALVFMQIKGLREELLRREDAAEAVVTQDEPMFGERGAGDGADTGVILGEMAAMESRLTEAVASVPDALGQDLEAIHQELRYLERSQGSPQHAPQHGSMGGHMGGGMSGVVSGGAKPDAYREAKLLLANGVDEERVISETGLTVEEVSLLKRLSNQESSRDMEM